MPKLYAVAVVDDNPTKRGKKLMSAAGWWIAADGRITRKRKPGAKNAKK